jgi:RNA polymerase sigma-70 factor (ECF subfamily)
MQDDENICKDHVYEQVFKTYSKDLKRFLYFKFNDMASAEDVLQESFIKLWNNCAKVEFKKVKSYLFTIANNAFLDIKKHEKVVRLHQEANVSNETSVSPEFIMLEEEFLSKIERVIASLPEKQREVFILSKIEKKKYREIAEQLGISVKAVEKRMRNALIVVREQIGNV